jgi:DNA repair protein RecN (Recombination protein N)
MLGLKSIIASKQNLSFVVFDEIDSGISGTTASHIAKRIKDISKSTQVLCITHLPHVASIADTQLYISKYENNSRTFTKIEELGYNDRVKQIAIMISGDKITQSSIENAKELLKG